MGEPLLTMVGPGSSSHGRIVLSKSWDRPGLDFRDWLLEGPCLSGRCEVEPLEEMFEFVHPAPNLESGEVGGHISQTLTSFVPLTMASARVSATKVFESNDEMNQALQMPPMGAIGLTPEILEGLVGLEPLPAKDQRNSIFHHTGDCTGFAAPGRARSSTASRGVVFALMASYRQITSTHRGKMSRSVTATTAPLDR